MACVRYSETRSPLRPCPSKIAKTASFVEPLNGHATRPRSWLIFALAPRPPNGIPVSPCLVRLLAVSKCADFCDRRALEPQQGRRSRAAPLTVGE